MAAPKQPPGSLPGASECMKPAVKRDRDDEEVDAALIDQAYEMLAARGYMPARTVPAPVEKGGGINDEVMCAESDYEANEDEQQYLEATVLAMEMANTFTAKKQRPSPEGCKPSPLMAAVSQQGVPAHQAQQGLTPQGSMAQQSVAAVPPEQVPAEVPPATVPSLLDQIHIELDNVAPLGAPANPMTACYSRPQLGIWLSTLDLSSPTANKGKVQQMNDAMVLSGLPVYDRLEIPEGLASAHQMVDFNSAHGIFSSHATKMLQELPQQVRECIIKSVLLSPKLWEHREFMVKDVYESFGTVVKQSFSFYRNLNACIVFRWHLWVVCSGIDVPILVWQRLLEKISQEFPQTQHIIYKVNTYEVDMDAKVMAQLIWEKTSLPNAEENKVPRCISKFRSDVLSTFVPEEGVYPAVLISTPCTDISCANQSDITPGCSRLHGPNSGLFWDALNGVIALQSKDCVEKVFFKFELPMPQDEVDLKEMRLTLGTYTRMDEADFLRASRKRYTWGNPQYNPDISSHLRPLYVKPSSGPYERCVDGSVWCPTPQVRQVVKVPAVLRSYYPKLLERQMRGDTLSAYEKMTLATSVVRTNDKNHFGGPAFFLEQLGLGKSPLAAFHSKFPCSNYVDTRDGSTPLVHSQWVSLCKQYILCKNCALVVKLLGQSWAYDSMTDNLYHSLRIFVQHHTGVDHHRKFKDVSAFNHYCGEQCPKRCPKMRAKKYSS
jgi:hypothetical protein